MKKVLNKLMVVLIALSLSLPYNVVSAEETDVVELSVKNCIESVDASSGSAHDVRYASNTAYFSVAYNDTITFDVGLSAGGRYEIAVLSGYSGINAAKSAIYLEENGEYTETLRKELEKSGDYSVFIPTVMGYINLKEGQNKIRFFHVSTDVHISGITLKRVGEISEDIITLTPEDITYTSGSASDDNAYFFLNTAQRADFSVDAKNGLYSVKLLCADYTRSTISVFANGDEYTRHTNEQTPSDLSYAINEAGIINLEDGTNSLTIRHSGKLNTFFWCKKIVLERIGNKMVTQISDGLQTVSGTCVNVVKAGYYKITPQNVPEKTALTYLADGEPCGTADSSHSCFIYLKSGEYLFKATDGAGNEYSSFLVEYIDGLTKDTERKFTENINSCENGEDVRGILTEHEEIFGVDLDSYLKTVGALEIVCNKMAENTYGSAGEIIEAFMALAKAEEDNPRIEVYSNGDKVSEITSGSYKILIDASYFARDITAICAVYREGRLEMTDVAEKEGGNSLLELEFTIESGDTYKILLLESLETIKPNEGTCGVYEKIYVSQEVKENGDGTEKKPFKTIDDALEKISSINTAMADDIVVFIDGGTYEITEPVEIRAEHGGKNGHNVIFKGNNTIISGGSRVESWEEHENGIYKAKFTADEVRNLYVNNIPAIRAKSEFAYRCEAVDGSTITVDAADMPEFSRPQDLELVFDLVWQNQRLPVTDLTLGENAEITVDANTYSYTEDLNYQTKPSQYDYFYIENALELLDNEGEFCYDKEEGYLYYYPYSDEIIDELEIIVPISNGILNIDGAENVRFDGISFMHGAWNDVSTYGFVGTQSSCMFDIKNDGSNVIVPAQIEINNAKGIDFTNCVFSCFGSSGINLENSVTDAAVYGSLFSDISGSGITIGSSSHAEDGLKRCSGITISNNVFTRNAIEYRCCPAIGVYYERDVHITQNSFDTLPYSGISLGWGWGGYDPSGWGNYVVKQNSFKNVMKTLDDGGGVYTMGRQNTVISENSFEDFGYISYSAAIHLDAGSANVKVYDNVVKNLERWIMVSQPAVHDNYVYSNYINTEKSLITSSEVEVKDNILFEEALPEAARIISDAAGVSPRFEHLKEWMDLPFGRKTIINDVPRRLKLEGTIYEAERYKEHSLYGVLSEKYSVGLDANAWVEYEVSVPEEGNYKLTLYASRVKSLGGVGKAVISKEDNELTEVYLEETGETWTDYLCFETGSFYLPEGTSTIKIKCTDYAFHMDCFALSKSE